MEMESSRRSIDRSREPGMKKPRLAEDQALDRDRPFPARASAAAGVGPLISRFRANEREGREDSIRGGGAYQQQQQQLDEQEIVAQYKTALSELTFNSKPIITNLTIIAGENTQAAKGIADVICANILEVPSDQKLPSLYLLDSIVKNIGRDYIRYFAARLPEVFCKAYKQVDSSIHSGMRHLFGTWKGVFPPPALQIIQKELAFPPVANGSTSGAVTSRPDSQSQRPPHSIHVNPKYLEARQRLQQTRAKGANIEDGSKTLSIADDAERSDRTAIAGSGRTWTDLPVKMPNIQHSQRDRPNEPVRKKSMGTGYGGDYEFDSDLPSQLDPGIGKASKSVSEREALDTPSYGTGRSMTNKTGLSQRNGFDASNAYVNYRDRDPRPTRATTQHPTLTMTNRSSQGTPESWKNSEEEEYMWEDMNSRLRDQSGTDSPRKDSWSTEEAEKPLKNQPKGKWMPLETELLDTSRWNTHDTLRMDKHSGSEERNPLQREVEEHLQPFDRQDFGSRAGRETSTSLFGQSAFRHRNPSLWSSQDLPPIGGLNHTSIASNPSGQTEGHPTLFSRNLFTSLSSSLNRKVLNPQAEPFASVNSGFGSHPSAISGSSETFGHQRKQSLGPPSPSAPSAMHQQPHSPSSSASLTEHNYAQVQSVSVPSNQSFHVPELLNWGSHVQINRDSSPVAPQRHAQPMHNSPLPFSQPLKHVQSSSPPLQPFTHQRHHQALSQQPESEPPSSLTQNLPQYKPPSVGPPLAVGYSELGLSKNPSEALGQSNTSSLLAAFVKGGLAVNLSAASGVSNSSNLELSHRTTRPPLPTGPPPTSSTPMAEGTSHGNLSSLVTSPLSAVQPPLPPGPPPSSSLKGTSSQVSNTSSAVPNPVSNLLSTLVAEGLISVPPTELVAIGGSQLPTHLQNRSIGQSKSSSILVSSSSASSALPHPLPDNENSRAVSNQKSASLSQAAAIEIKHLIGVEFKPEVIRGIHPTVINALVDDLPHQCCICGLRFRLQEQLSSHLDWHNTKKLELSSCNEVSRKWYASLGDWVAGNAGLSLGPSTTMEEGTASVEEKSEPMVPADESQSICILCGEPFEDWYSEERDEWMYKGAVYMPTTAGEGDLRDTHAGRPIVHPNCISGSLRDDC